MKKYISIIFAICLIVNMSVVGSAVNVKDELVLEDSFDIVTYDYLTKTESSETLFAENSIAQKAYIEATNSMTKTGNNSREFSLSNPGYFPSTISTVTEEEISPKTIIGSDNRKKVSPTTYPYSAVMFLHLGQDTTGNGVANSWKQATGFMVGKKAMVTAAHCYWDSTYGWVEECRTYKNQNSSTIGSTYYYPASWTCPSNYTNSGDTNYDWCVVIMQNDIGSSTGYFGYGTGGSMVNNTYAISGYPGEYEGYQYKSTGTVSYETSYICRYNIDITPGQSGSPVYATSDNIVWAINTRQNTSYNIGNKITSWCYDLITEARAA